MGLAMLVLGALFLRWQRWRPTELPSKDELAAAADDDRPPTRAIDRRGGADRVQAGCTVPRFL
jgi:hypothetical protein